MSLVNPFGGGDHKLTTKPRSYEKRVGYQRSILVPRRAKFRKTFCAIRVEETILTKGRLSAPKIAEAVCFILVSSGPNSIDNLGDRFCRVRGSAKTGKKNGPKPSFASPSQYTFGQV